MRTNFPELQYQGVGGLTPGRAVLPLGHAYSVDMKFGKLYPIVAEECIAGDVVKYNCDVIARMNPSIVPFMHEINITWHAFFHPFRLSWPKVDQTGDDWESYIVGDTWDPDSGTFVTNSAELPLWDYSAANNYAKDSLYDYLGFQPGVVPPTGHRPHQLYQRTYVEIFNEHYRDEDLVARLDPTVPLWKLLDSALEKDYFTSARPFQQKGISPALPVTGIGQAVFDGDVDTGWPSWQGSVTGTFNLHAPGNLPGDSNTEQALEKGRALKAGVTGFGLDDNTVDFTEASTVNISDLRLSIQIQKYLERNARGGNRYTEWLQSHYGVSPSDARLQRPEYLGGGKIPIIVSEVLQTSMTSTTPQGTLAGHGIAVGRSNVVDGYRVKEPGIFMVIARILPRTMYTQGVPRRAIRNSPYEFYHPEFAHLSEQAVTKGELFVTGTSTDNDIFGFQARYQEYRTRNSIAVNEMRDTLKQWNLGRSFDTQPTLSESFISVTDSQRTQWMNRSFAVTSQAPFIVSFGNQVLLSRPMPGLPEPGLMDHF